MIPWPEPLVEAIARRRAVVYIGAGVSRSATNKDGERPPDWRGFLARGLAACGGRDRNVLSALKHGDFLTACELIRHKLDERWIELLKDTFVKPKYAASNLHEAIFRLDARLFLTTNFDKIFDNYASRKSEGTISIKSYNDGDVGSICRSEDQIILKIHGTIDNPTRMIFTRSDYAHARIENASFYRVLDAIMLANTFLFVGAGLNDPDVNLILESQALLFPDAPPHYITMASPMGDDLASSIRRNFNLKVIKYSPREDHQELVQSMERLADLAEGLRTS